MAAGSPLFCEPNLTAREAACARVAARKRVRPSSIHSTTFRVAAGQATAAIEFLEDTPSTSTTFFVRSVAVGCFSRYRRGGESLAPRDQGDWRRA